MNLGFEFAKLARIEKGVSMKSNLLILGLLGVTFLGSFSAVGQTKGNLQTTQKVLPQESASKGLTNGKANNLLSKSGISDLEKMIVRQIELDKQKQFGINGTKLLGGDGSGGGNPEEVTFIREAIQIHEWLSMNPEKLKNEFGFALNVYTEAIQTTQVACAPELYLSYIRSLNKKVYFINGLKSVFLDCDKFEQTKADQVAFRSVVFHEYMRSAGLEGEDTYKYSSRIHDLVTRIWNEAHTPVPGVYASQGSRNKIIVGYSARTMFLISNFFYGDDIHQVKMELVQTQPGKWVAHGQIEVRSRVRFCTYPVKVEFVPVTGYTKPVADVKTTLPVSLPSFLAQGCPQPPQKTRVENPFVKIQDL